MSRSYKSNQVRDIDLSEYNTETRQGKFAVEMWTSYKRKSANKKRTSKIENSFDWDA